jgi:hypothetical protein
MLSKRSFFSLAKRNSSSLLRITGPDVGAGTAFGFVLDEARETFDMLDLDSSAPFSL